MDDHHSIAKNFYRVRQALGLLGFFLPIFLIFGGVLILGRVEPSLSDYYHTALRDVFVGILAAISIFLMCYTGHPRGEGEKVSDDWVTTLTGIAALGVAIFPNGPGHDGGLSLVHLLVGQSFASGLHYISAVVFLASAGYVSFFRFARTAKPFRRRIYRACGRVIWGVTVIVIITSWFKVKGPAAPQTFVREWYLVLWFEVLGIWAFSIAWLVKGRVDMGLLHLFYTTVKKQTHQVKDEDQTPQ